MAWCVGRPSVFCHRHASLVLVVTAESAKQLEGNRFKNQGCKEKLRKRTWHPETGASAVSRRKWFGVGHRYGVHPARALGHLGWMLAQW